MLRFLLNMIPASEEMPPAKRIRRGGTDDLDSSDQGTQEVANLLDWPRFAISNLPLNLEDCYNEVSQLPAFFPPSESARERGLISRLVVTTAYTGLGTVEHCLDRLASASGGFQQVLHWSGFERDPKCRDVILQSAHCPNHLFGDLEDLFEPDVVTKMYACTEVLKKRAEARCKEAANTEESRQVVAAHSKRCMSKLFQMAKQGIQDGKVRTHLYCWVHGGYCQVHPTLIPGDCALEAGGNSCVAFSPQGTRSQWLHGSNVATALWLALTGHRGAQNELHLLLQECSSLFTTEECFELAMPENFRNYVCKLSCRDVGVPMQRLRKFSWAVNTRAFTVTVDITKDFFQTLCGSPPLCDGHDYFFASEKTVQAHYRAASKWRQWWGPSQTSAEDGMRLSADCVLCAGARVRLVDYNQFLREQSGEHPRKEQCGVVDLSQNVSARPVLKAELPSLLCQSLLWSQYHGRCLLPIESLGVMGWPIPELLRVTRGGSITSPCPWSEECLMSARPGTWVKMAGNAMHCRLTGLFLAACLSVTRPVQPVAP